MHARFNRILLCFMGRRDKSWQRLQAEDERRSRGGQNLFSCPSKRSSPLHFSLRCIIYTISSNNAAGLLSIIDRIKTAYPGISWSINEATLRDRERTKLILHRSVESHRSNGRNRKVSANCWKDRSVRFETRAQTTRVQQHNTVRSGTRCDLTQRELPHRQPTRRPHAHWHWRSLQACTANPSPSSAVTTPSSRPAILAPHCSMAFRVSLPRTRTRLAHFSATLHCALSVLFLPIASTLAPSSLLLSFAYPSPSSLSFSLSFHFPFDSVLAFLLPVSRFFFSPPLFCTQALVPPITRFYLID